MLETSKASTPPAKGFLFPWLHIPEVWQRFLLALGGLVAAFAAALFSTVSRESGNRWATLLLASIALLLATVVGLTTVPYLARRVASARLRDAFDYDVTRAGMVYVVVILVIGIAALNTGNNLLYIIVASMLAAIVVSGVASALILRKLELEVRVPEHVFAERPLLARIVLRNRRRWLPSFSISVVSPKKERSAGRWQWMPEKFAFPPGRRPERQWFAVPDRRLRRVRRDEARPGLFEGAAYFPFLPAGEEVSADLNFRFARRGLYQQQGFGLATGFPFAFLVKTRRIPITRNVVVYPRVEPTDELFEILPLITGELETFARGRGADLYRIREYMPEDSARHLDWKATAKSGSPKLREFSREDERKLRVVFDNPCRGQISDVTYERAVSLAASLAWHFAGADAEVSFLAADRMNFADIYAFLAYLAVVEPGESSSLIDRLPVTPDYNIIISTRHRGTIPTPLWTCSYFVFVSD
jgi:uncharacterized protein (DUF58 family)